MIYHIKLQHQHLYKKAVSRMLSDPLQDVQAILQLVVFLPQLLQTCRCVQVLWVLQTLDLSRESLDLPLLEKQNVKQNI